MRHDDFAEIQMIPGGGRFNDNVFVTKMYI